MYNFHNSPQNNSLASGSLGAKLFDNTQSLKDQVAAMENRSATFGFILSSGYQDVCEVPVNANFYVMAMKYSTASAIIIAIRLGPSNETAAYLYITQMSSSTWRDWYVINTASAVSTTSLTSEDSAE